MKILFLSLTNIGDVILSTVLMNRILETHPNAQFDVICGPKAVDLFEGCPHVRKVIPLKKQKRKMHHWQLLKIGFSQHYDLVVDLRTPLWGRLVRASRAIMGRHKGQGLVSQHYASLWPSNKAPRTKVWPGKATRKSTTAWLTKRRTPNTPLIAICPTANWEGKMWPKAKVAEFMQLYAKKPVQFVLLGSPNEREKVKELFDVLPQGRVIDAFDTNLTEAAVIFEHCAAVVANDSGLAHLAGAAGAPLAVLFGPMDEGTYTPVANPLEVIIAPEAAPGTHDLPPNVKPRPMGGITPQVVAKAVDNFLKQRKVA
jgi:ADP-heptose:LPS heptosyltransferase